MNSRFAAPAFAAVLGRISEALDLPIECALVDRLELTYGSSGASPLLHNSPAILPFSLGRQAEI